MPSQAPLAFPFIVARFGFAVLLFLTPAGAMAQPGTGPAPADGPADVLDPDTRLLRAAMQGQLPQVKQALADGASLEATTDSGVTAISVAALHGRDEVVAALAAAGANVSTTDITGATPLMFAAAQGHAKAVEALTARGADVNATDKSGMTALMAAASSGRVEAMRVLIDKGANVNAADKQGTSALMAAAFGGHSAAGKLLLDRGANANVRDESARTALMATALSGDTALAAALLSAKADLNAEDLAGSTALTYAASSGHAGIVDLLMKAGLTKGADMAVSFAVRGCHTDIVKTLRVHGAVLDRKVNGTPPLVLAAGSNCDDTVRYLLDGGADVNAGTDEDGMTPLMAAAQRGLAPIGELLIARGADPEARNKKDQTAWYYAAMNQHQEFVELLRKIRDSKPPAAIR